LARPATGLRLRRDGGGRKVIVGLNDKVIWNKPGDRTVENHFVLVTGIDTRAGMVHLNDTGSSVGRDEQVSMANFEQAWGTATTSPS
jgi:hypothetical protein